MREHGDADAGAGVGRARGQVAELIVEGVVEAAVEEVVHLVEPVEGLAEAQPRGHALQPQVILFVDHDGEAFAAPHQHAAKAPAADEIAAHQPTLHQDLQILLGHLVQRQIRRAVQDRKILRRTAHASHDRALLLGGRARGKGQRGEVAREAGARGENGVVDRARFHRPGGGLPQQRAQNGGAVLSVAGHAPRLSPTLAHGFHLANAVAQLGRALVVFGKHRAFEFFVEPAQLCRALVALPLARGALARVLRAAVQAAQERFEFGGEGLIAATRSRGALSRGTAV